MPKQCKIINLDLQKLRNSLAELRDSLANESISQKEFRNRLNEIKLTYLGLGGKVSKGDFDKLLSEFQIDKGFLGTKIKAEPALVNTELAYENRAKIFLSGTYGHVQRMFTRNMFKALFVDNTDYGQQTNSSGKLLNNVVKRIPLNRSDINSNIVEFKNKLVDYIASELEIDRPKKVFKALLKKADYASYKEFLTTPKVVAFISNNINSLPTATSKVLDLFSAIFILNNFDNIVQDELHKILSPTSDYIGDIKNFDYVLAIQGNQPDVWAADNLTNYGAELYASNLGKFILKTIPKVTTSLQNIDGAYMQSQDAFVVSSLLKEAEYEYHIVLKNDEEYDPNLSIKRDARYAAKKLMELGISGKLPQLHRYTKEIFPIYNWLYGDKNGTISIRKITNDTLKSGKVYSLSSIINLEDILIGEITKNVAPVYLEYNVPGENQENYSPIRTIYAAHTFRGTDYIRGGIYRAAEEEFMLPINQKNIFYRDPLQYEILKNLSDTEILTGSEEIAVNFRKVFSELFNTELNQDVINSMFGKDKMNKIISVVSNITNVIQSIYNNKDYTDITDYVAAFNKRFRELSSGESDIAKSIKNVLQACADVSDNLPVTIIRNSQGNGIPVNRLNSQVFEDVYLINNFKQNKVNRSSLNLFVGNTHLLSNINDPNNLNSINLAYQGSTGLRLETIYNSNSNSATESSAEEQWKNNFLGDFIALGLDPNGHSISVQLMTYSDKVSIFTKIINLDGVIQGYGNKEINKSLHQMSNDELIDLYYYYQKNQAIDRIFKIIEDWNKLMNLGIVIPDINRELMNTSNEVLPEIYEFIQNSWKLVNDRLLTLSENGSPKEVIENLLRAYPDEIDIVKDFHYSIYNKKLRLNKNIYSRFADILNKDSVTKNFYRQAEVILRYPACIDTFNREDLKPLIQKYADEHEINLQETVVRHRILDNLVRSQMLDLGFKGPFLDAVKGVSDYDEFTDERMRVVESDKRFKAAGKRTVDLGGTKQNFQQGLLNGVSEVVKVAHIEEPLEKVFNPDGEQGDLEILNGSARTSFIYFMQEQASLNKAETKNISLKTLWSHVGDYTSTLYKWAEYVINNWHMRTSAYSKYSLSALFEKMHDIPFEEEIDLTKSFLNPNGVYTVQQANGGRDVYYADGMSYFKLLSLKYLGDNNYEVRLCEVDKYGNELLDSEYTHEVNIYSLYSLYLVLGGMESMELGQDGILTYSDDSLKMLYNYVTNIGTVIDDSGIYDQKSVHQPLRDKFIAVAASTSAIKRGETNTNNPQVYENYDDDLLITKAKTNLSGEQTDYGHVVDDEISATEPTQTLAALATNGTNTENAQQVYDAIASIIQDNMSKLAKQYNIDTLGSESVIKNLSKEISLKCAERGNDIQNSIIDLCELYLGGIVPLSENSFYQAFHTWNIIELNRLAIRRKFSGLGGIIAPSNNSLQLFNIDGQELTYEDLILRARQVFSEYSDLLNKFGFNTEKIVNLYLFSKSERGEEVWEILQSGDLRNVDMNLYTLQDLTDETIKSMGVKTERGDVDILETVFYKVNGQWKRQTLDTLDKVMDFYNNPNITEVYRDITTPHDLKPQIIKYRDSSGQVKTMFNQDATLLNYEINQLGDLSEDDLLASLGTDGEQLKQYCSVI